MTVNINPNSPVGRLNNANANTIADQAAALDLGSILRRQRVSLRRQNPNVFAAGAASSYDLATLQVIVLPDDAKALALTRVEVRTGTGTTGLLTTAAPYTTPVAHVPAVTPAGNIGFLATDAYTDVDIDYEVISGDVIEITVPVVPGTGVGLIPVARAGTAGMGTTAANGKDLPSYVGNPVGVLVLIEAEALAGTTIGKKIILAPGAVPGTTGQANLSLTKLQAQFTIADAVTSARLKMVVCSATDLHALLEASSTNF